MKRAQRKRHLTVYEMRRVSAICGKFYALEGCWSYDNICRSQLMEVTHFVTTLVQTLEHSLLLHLEEIVTTIGVVFNNEHRADRRSPYTPPKGPLR